MEVVHYKKVRSERAIAASGRTVFDSSRNFGYFWPKQAGDAMITVPLGEARNNLSKRVDEAASGKIITIAKHGRAMAQLVTVGESKGQRIGAMKGKLVIAQDFDAPLPDDLLDAFEGSHR